MKQSEITLFEEAFTHVKDDETGHQTTYAVSSLREYCDAHFVLTKQPISTSDELALTVIEKCNVPVEQHHADYCRANRGIEEHRLARLVDGGPAVVLKPIIFVRQADGSMLLVDGTHRYVLAHMLGVPFVPGYFVPWNIARPFIIEDAPACDPEALMNSWSGF